MQSYLAPEYATLGQISEKIDVRCVLGYTNDQQLHH